ncbi:hypothetical protein RS030_111970 [Cryptosporidium xiaoi]|uniref:P-type ATPase A domain-containing protein n=1 Tax=Cryptosporidium xiaoi TaxID=659607 RepID=A0AAV9Y4I7_9CRYT
MPSSDWCEPSNTIISINFALNYLKIVGFYFILLSIWGICRELYNRYIFLKDVKKTTGSNYIGYRDCISGRLLKYTYPVLILLSQIFLWIVIWNVICSSAVSVQPYWNERAKTYIIFYCTGLTLCLLMHFTEPFLTTFFLVHESLDKCKYIKSKGSCFGICSILNYIGIKVANVQKDDDNNNENRKNNYDCKINFNSNKVNFPLLRVFESNKSSRYFCYNQVTYTYSNSVSDFVSHNQNDLFDDILNNINTNSTYQGLSTNKVKELLFNIGKNNIELQVPNIINVFIREMLHPFNILRFGSLYQGIFLRFYIWSVLWFIVILFTTIKTLRIIISSQKNIKEALNNYIERLVTIKRDGCIMNVPSHELVPGDLILLPNGFTAPCDIYVLSGCAIVNESFITGESSPVVKMQIEVESRKSTPNNDRCSFSNSNSECDKKTCSTFDSINNLFLDTFENDHFSYSSEGSNLNINHNQSQLLTQKPIYMGTKIINSISSNESINSALGVVYRTGIYSSHGQLLYKTINTYSNMNSYSISNIKYIRNIYTLWIIMFILGILIIIYQNFTLGWSTGSFFFAVGTFIQILPLWAPTCVQFSLSKSVERLENNHLMKTSFPMDIPVAGKVKVLCLDKTGTLTSNKMVFIGIVDANDQNNFNKNDIFSPNIEKTSKDFGDLASSTSSLSSLNLKSTVSLNNVVNNTVECGNNVFNKLNLQIQNENNYETSTISIDEEDPLINKKIMETFNHSKSAKHLLDLPPIIDVNSLNINDITYIGLCCCNNLIPNNSENGILLLGNDIDKAIFSNTCAKIKIQNEKRYISLNENSIHSDSVENVNEYPLQVIRINEFDWNYQCMSVVVHHRILNKYFVFCKGSLESLMEITKKPDCSSLNTCFDTYKDSIGDYQQFSCNMKNNEFNKENSMESCNGWEVSDKDLVDAREVLSFTMEMDLKSPMEMKMSHDMKNVRFSKFLDKNNIVNGYSKLGYYVMGMSYKEIKDPVLLDALINKPRSNVSRRTIESDLTIINYLLFYNNIRPSTREFISNVKLSGIKPVILTGDSPYTALSVAQKSGIIGLNSKIAIGDLIHLNGSNKDVLVWHDYIIGPTKPIPNDKIYNSSEYNSLIVTSRAFLYLLNNKYDKKNDSNNNGYYENGKSIEKSNNTNLNKCQDQKNDSFLSSNSSSLLSSSSKSTLTSSISSSSFSPISPLLSSSSSSSSLLDLVFDRIKIFARSSPEHKRLVVQEYKKKNIVTGMIGDGVNDLPAFKMADMSISVHEKITGYPKYSTVNEDMNNNDDNISNNSNQYSSPMTLAFSSFSVESDNILKVIDLVKEGRASMVTTLALFMFLSFQGVFYSIYKNILFTMAQANLPVMTYVFIDIALVFPSIWLMILCKPKKYIRSIRPTSNLLGPNVIISFLSLLITSLFFYSIMITRLLNSNWVTPSYEHNKSIPVEMWFQRQDNYEASTTFIWMGLQLSSISLILSFGGNFRERVTRNKFLILWVFICHAFLLLLCTTGPNALTCLFRVNCTDSMDRHFNISLFGFNIFTITGGKFRGSSPHNLFPFNWKIEFIFWNYSSIFFMSIIYWWITSKTYSKVIMNTD